MRIVHFADNHLGAGSDRREQDILDSFQTAIDKIIALSPDLVINAGDLFDMVRPSNRVIAFASEQLQRLGRDAGIPTVIIAGNHDAPKQMHIGPVLSIFRGFENIHVVCDSRLERIRIGQACVTAIPHCLTAEIMREELGKASPDPTARYNILVMHGVIEGLEAFRMADLAEQEIPGSILDLGFDYVALGHYHKYQKISPAGKMAYYSGSTERMSQAESTEAKGLIEIDFSRNCATDPVIFHELAARSMVDLPAVKASGKSADQIIAEIEAAVKAQKPEDKIIRVSITDIPEETYRALPFNKLADLKKEAFSLDIRFEKEKPPEENLYADLNLNRLDVAFEKFLSSHSIENLDKEHLKQLSLDYLHRAEADES